ECLVGSEMCIRDRRMWRGAGMKREASDQARSLPLLGIGLAVGLLSGLMGVGGGFLVVPGLLWFTPLSMMAATATSMAVIALVSGCLLYTS
ncbi:sulfite exporter TauE/SafE family protein, partial [Pseudomonas aeruginosa]|nr:sulfite exporter TauE/SafE family protein [Pseudomonas aeruginosa]